MRNNKISIKHITIAYVICLSLLVLVFYSYNEYNRIRFVDFVQEGVRISTRLEARHFQTATFTGYLYQDGKWQKTDEIQLDQKQGDIKIRLVLTDYAMYIQNDEKAYELACTPFGGRMFGRADEYEKATLQLHKNYIFYEISQNMTSLVSNILEDTLNANLDYKQAFIVSLRLD